MNQPTVMPQSMMMGNVIRPGMMPTMSAMPYQPTAPGYMQRMVPSAMMQPGMFIPGMS